MFFFIFRRQFLALLIQACGQLFSNLGFLKNKKIWGTISRTSISYIIAFTWYFMIVTKDLFVRDQKRVSSMTIKLIFNRSSHERYWPLQKRILFLNLTLENFLVIFLFFRNLDYWTNSWPRACIRKAKNCRQKINKRKQRKFNFSLIKISVWKIVVYLFFSLLLF